MQTLWPSEHNPLTSQQVHRLNDRLIASFEEQLTQLKINTALSSYLPSFYIPFAAYLYEKKSTQKDTLIIGINGAQGCGKSTTSQLLANVLRQGFGLKVTVLSIDELYKTRAQRAQMAKKSHPLFKTRGVPGTHDTALGIQCIQRLSKLRSGETLAIPRFDKGNDDRLPKQYWPLQQGPIDIILFEGWCVGAPSQLDNELTVPINTLEATDDSQLIWRRTVNEHLKTDYKALFALLDYLVFIHIPSFDCVLKWRGLQEQKLIERQHHEQHLMHSAKSLQRFINHYERLTRFQLQQLPKIADVTIKLSDDHHIKHVSIRRT